MNGELAACYGEGVDPDWWFAEPVHIGNKSKQRKIYHEQAYNAAAALAICMQCPLQKACLQYALDNPKLTAYGTWGGLLAYERRQVLGMGRLDISIQHQKAIRAYANKRNIPMPELGKRERQRLLAQSEPKEQ